MSFDELDAAMIWTTWRQHRAEALVGGVILAALAAAMIVVGKVARTRARALGLPSCATTAGDCGRALSQLHRDFHSIPPVTAALIAVPLLAGMFWTAPLLSREYEAGTHRLAWTQSVSPLRWIVTKLVLILTTVGAASLALGLLATWALDPLEPAFGGRYNSTWYDIQGAVAVACMVFALSLGIVASALIRRTVPAMAVTLVGYAAARIPVHFFRAHFAPLSTRSATITVSRLLQNGFGSPQDLTGPLPSGSWQQGTTITDSAGHRLATSGGNLGILRHYCPNLVPERNGDIHLDPACQANLQHTSIRETVTYQAASHFWLIQTVESAIFIGASGVLIMVAVLCVLRRRPA